jgi:hypothetical protein
VGSDPQSFLEFTHQQLHAECKATIDRLQSIVTQVDDVLVVNWIEVKEGDYRKALHDLVAFNIQIENDPSVSPTAKARQDEIDRLTEQLKRMRTSRSQLYTHSKPCHYCAAPIDDLATDPGLWGIGLCHEDDPGVIKWHHVGCILKRLKENESLKTQLSDMASALMHYVDWFGPAHAEDCPGNDTCDCQGQPINDAVNAVLKGRF